MTAAAFKGSSSQQALAEEIFRLMITQGTFFAVDAPIKQSLTNLAEFLSSRSQRDAEEVATEIDAALRANDTLFQREEHDGQVIYITSRQGNYIPRNDADTHSFRKRLHEPENPLPIDDISVVVSTSRPAITTVEPVFISDYWQIQAGMVPVTTIASINDISAELAAEIDAVDAEDLEAAEAAEAVIAEEPEVLEPVAAEEPEVLEPVAAEEPEVLEPVAAEEPVVAEVAPVVAPPSQKPVRAEPASSSLLTLPDGLSIDLRRGARDIIAEHGPQLEKILADRLDQDPLRRIVSFGRSHYPEASVANLGKNDLRKIRDYILERNEPLLDTELIADVFYHNPRQSDYESFRFSLNYRLNREKDFEFVGVEGARLWSTKGLPALGTKRVKAAEMGQITSYLVEGYDNSLEQQSKEAIISGGTVTRLLSFFEWEYGVLPLDASLSALVPTPMLPDQRSAVLRFESPQHYTNYLVEVRYPTGNRGGWLQGLEEFFREHLVPGALINIARGNEANVFTISYEEAPEASDRLLTLDEKKNKFAFATLSYYCAVDEDQLLSQSRYGKLKNLKSLPMGERRKSEMVLEHVFETIGEQIGTRSEPRYRSGVDELLTAFNVLRPGSKSLLLNLLENGERFDTEDGRYTYLPEARDDRNDDEEEEDLEDLQPTRRRFGRYSDDDE